MCLFHLLNEAKKISAREQNKARITPQKRLIEIFFSPYGDRME